MVRTTKLIVSKKSSGMLGILVVVIVSVIGLIIGGIIYYLRATGRPVITSPKPATTPTSSTPVQTQELKIYTDEKNGFSFEYPADWQVTVLPKAGGNLVLKSPAYVPLKSGTVTFGGEVYMLISPNPKDLSVKDLYATYNDTSSAWFTKFKFEEINSPLPGVKFPLIQESGINYNRTDYIFKANKKVIVFAYQYNSPAVMDEFNKIAMSLKLITSSSLVYINTDYGFTFTLPQTWQGYTVSTSPGPDPKIVSLTLKSPNADALPVGLLNIYLFTKAEWNSHPKKPKYIMENNLYIFATDPEDTPPNECVQLDAFQCARRKEMPGIINTFKLINN